MISSIDQKSRMPLIGSKMPLKHNPRIVMPFQIAPPSRASIIMEAVNMADDPSEYVTKDEERE